MLDFLPETLGDKISNAYAFYGAEAKPLLAPRGVHIHKEKLFISDTGQNRVFIWNKIPTEKYQEPDVILGQKDGVSTGRNQKGTVTADSLQYPSGIWANDDYLIVADAWNHRVLIWDGIPTHVGQKADVVLGQPTFEQNLPNVLGIGKALTSKSLNWPYGVWSDGTSLWIADTGNRRVLYYEKIPLESYTGADQVIGKDSFSTRDYNNDEPLWPYSVKVNATGQLLVADTQFYRTLLWKNAKTAAQQKADIIIGQNTFDACGQNQYHLFPAKNTLNWVYDAIFYKKGMLINDTGNSRILYFKNIPTSNNPEADAVIGKRNFKTGSENKDTLLGTNTSLYWPFSLSTKDETIAIADTGNQRIIFGQLLI